MIHEKEFDVEFDYETEQWGTVSVHIVGTRAAISEATVYDSNGDPGEDAEGGVLTYDSIEVLDDEGNDVWGVCDIPQYVLDDRANEACDEA